jgi:hypothetical protein
VVDTTTALGLIWIDKWQVRVPHRQPNWNTNVFPLVEKLMWGAYFWAPRNQHTKMAGMWPRETFFHWYSCPITNHGG